MIKVTLYYENANIYDVVFIEDSEADEVRQYIEDGYFEEDGIRLESVDWDSQDYEGYKLNKEAWKKLGNAAGQTLTPEKKAHLDALINQQQLHHKFSEDFEGKMDDALRVYRRKKRLYKLRRYAAVAAAVIVCVTGGIALSTANSASASKPGINIMEWVKDHFSFTKDDAKKTDVLFTEEQIGYMPEGFEKTGEEINTSYVEFEYSNTANSSIILRVDITKTVIPTDNENISLETYVNSAGYEYTHIYKKDVQSHVLMWEDKNRLFYNLYGTVDEETMIKIMDGINYDN